MLKEFREFALKGNVVDLAVGTCTCPDFAERRLPCKHQWALRYFRHELELPDGSTGLDAARESGVHGKDATPFLLDWFHRETAGASLAANVALVLANARLAAEVAAEYAG